ncbi:hypothetical protein QR680_015643 [Steinernema hermaphroditum]|uniref:Uncharacterized protein n=1 Tax=Steinernema hermaphroditum TaxID=289476 RepID=A0AA39LL46_9BILA|nr:hypothetical protein QR680_015643 [Steinernema hermaphroditum]
MLTGLSTSNEIFIQKVALSVGISATITSTLLVIFFLITDFFSYHFRTVHLLFNVVMTIISVTFTVGVHKKRADFLAPFICGNITLLISSYVYILYFLKTGKDLPRYVKLMHEGIMDWEDEAVSHAEGVALVIFLVLELFVLPSIYLAVAFVYYCSVIRRKDRSQSCERIASDNYI